METFTETTVTTEQPDLKKSFQNRINQAVDDRLFAGCAIGYSDGNNMIIAHSNTKIPGSKVLFSDKTLFDIASLTKCFVAVAVLRLIDDSFINLDTPINRYIPGTGKRFDEITIKHLLTNSLQLDITEKLYLLTPDQVQKIVLQADVKNLDDGYYYHNTTSLLLGWFLERYYHGRLANILREKVLRSAKMEETFFSHELSNRTKRHVPPSMNKRLDGNAIFYQPHDELANMYARHGRTVACAGIFSTVRDMLKFGQHIVYGAFRNQKEMHDAMLKNYLEPHGRTFGLGFDKPDKAYLCPHFAESTLIMTAYTGCNIWIQPKNQKVLTILSNVTYPPKNEERKIDPIKGPVSPLSEFRQGIAREAFYCEYCTE